MEVTIVGDPHAKPNNLDKINALVDMVEALGNPVIWLGDMLDTKELVRASCLNTWLSRFKASKLKHYVLVGNHDYFNLDCKEHSLEPLKELPNVTIIDVPQTVRLGRTTCRLYPYMRDLTLLKADLGACQEDIVLGHLDVRTFDYGNGLLSEEGLEVEDFSKFKRVISGHYHKYQERENITYLGTPFSHSFGESNQRKYIGVYNLETDHLKLIETPFPRHMTTEIDAGTCFNDVLLANGIHRIILRGTQEEIDRFERLDGVKYIEEPTSSKASSAINEVDSPEVQFVKWARDIKGYSDEIVELGLEILGDV